MWQPHGSWPSPITSCLIAEKKIRITELGIGGKDREVIQWIERRPTENGRNVICGYNLFSHEKRDITFSGMNSRCTVHEYGGGDFCPLPDSQHVLTIDHCSKNIKLLNYETNSFVNITTPEDQIYRYGDIALDPLNRGYIYAIREDHSIDIPSRVINSVVAIPFPVNLNGEWQYSPVDSQVTLANVDQDPSIMYSTPRVHPSGKFLCWMEWSHPNMPWDQSSIFVGLLSNDGSSILSKVKVAGGPNESVHHPRWIPSGDNLNEYSLVYVSDIDSGWWNIHRVTLKFFDSLHDFDTIQISHSPMLIAPGYEFCKPQWNLGTKYFDFITTTAGCKLVSIWHDTNHSMFAVTCDPHQSHTLPLTSDQETDIQVIPVPPVLLQTQQIQLTTCNSLQVAFDSTIILLSGSATLPLAIYSWNLHHPDNITLIQCSVPLESVELIPSSFLSIPQHVTFPTYSDPLSGADNVAYGWYYPPTHPIYAPAGNSNSTILPPLLVKCHGGPTGSTSIEYRLDIQYFTSRGIAVLDVDYTGSTGYGREYRQRLYRQWGVHDRKDCIHGVKYLITKGLVDEKRVAIDGSSAGGYTTLAAITIDEEKVFTAASSSYGIGDLTLLLADTHKFESHYLTQLIGPADTHLELYQSRSPINYVNQIQCSLLLLQGTEDRVVPPNQAQTMYEAVKSNGIPTALVLFEGMGREWTIDITPHLTLLGTVGEGHGWRKAENIKRALRLEYSFYGAVFGFVPQSEEAEELTLVNWTK